MKNQFDSIYKTLDKKKCKYQSKLKELN